MDATAMSFMGDQIAQRFTPKQVLLAMLQARQQAPYAMVIGSAGAAFINRRTNVFDRNPVRARHSNNSKSFAPSDWSLPSATKPAFLSRASTGRELRFADAEFMHDIVKAYR